MARNKTYTLGYFLRKYIFECGGLRKAARELDIDPGYLCKLRDGEKDNPGDVLLDKLGLEKCVRFRNKRVS